MNRQKIWTICLILLLGIGLAQVAEAHWRGGGHWRGGVDIVIGPPILGWGYYPPPPAYYYPPPVIVSPPPQPVYVEQNQPAQAPAQNYWYYCPNPAGYYPSVKECPSGWLKVVPETQPGK